MSGDGALPLLLRLDFPAVQRFVKLDSKATFGQLKAEAVKLFGVKEADMARSEFRAVAFGQNVLDVGQKGNDRLLSEDGVKAKSMILITAPTDLKPVKERKKKKNIKGDDEEEDAEDLKEKYKGLKSSTIVKRLLDDKLNSRDETIALEFFDMHAAKAVKASDWNRVDKKRMKEFVQRKTISIPEAELFEAVVSWAKAQLKTAGKDGSNDNIRSELSEILPHIRFPTMTMEEIATKVTPTSILTGEQTLAIFTYLGSSKDKQKSMKMPYPTKQREPRKPLSWFTWSPDHKHYSLQLSEKNMVAMSTDPNSWWSCGGNIEYKKGVHEWEVQLTQYDPNQSYNVVIGVVPSSYSNWSNNSWIGSSTTAPGWAFVTGNGYKTSTNSGQQGYGTNARQGDAVKLKLDVDKHTLEFFVNNRSLGVAFTDVYGPVRPALSLIRTQKVTLKFK